MRDSFVKPTSDFLVYLWEHTSRVIFIIPGCMFVNIVGEYDIEKNSLPLRFEWGFSEE